MSGISVLPVPKDELDRVATANVDLVEVAKTLANLAAQTTDQQMAATLRAQVEKILHTSNTVSNAVRSASYLAR
jgi:hypothetical protein